MAFNSLEYTLLLAISAGLFFGLGYRGRLLVLVAASVVFYGAFSVPLLAGSRPRVTGAASSSSLNTDSWLALLPDRWRRIKLVMRFPRCRWGLCPSMR